MGICLFLFILWLVFNGTVTVEICLIGVLLSAGVYGFCVYALGYHPRAERRLVIRVAMYTVYFFMLMWEILKSCLTVMKIILIPPHRYHAAIVRLRVPFRENISRVILSNSITLTPGTVTVAQEGDEFLVLCLNKADAQHIPQWNLVRFLKKVEDKVCK